MQDFFLKALLLLAVGFVPFCKADFDIGDLRSLPPIPSHYGKLELDERIEWLNTEIAKPISPLESYRLKRILFLEYYYQSNDKKAAQVCSVNLPLRLDFLYREMCAIATFPVYKDLQQHLLEIVHDARQSENFTDATQVLINLAWRQSQNGDISAAYNNYETALALAPTEDIELLNTVMLDTATNYIVHGDEDYVQKGISLLDKIRAQSKDALETLDKNANRSMLLDTIHLTNFNTGIAYALHLYDYEKALEFFDELNSIKTPYLISALSFSAMAAAELEQYDRAKHYIAQAELENETDPTISHYLTCYRELAIRHWKPDQTIEHCLTLPNATTVEVQIDVVKRLTSDNDETIRLAGLRKLNKLFLEKLEPQLKARGSSAASNTELQRLERESELKSLVLQQQKELQEEREATHANRQLLFIALFIILIAFILLIVLQLRQKKKLAEQFERMSIRDSLTKLGNRRFIERQIGRELAYVSRAFKDKSEVALGIYLFDIDHFKQINDTYGHQAGDEVLIEISKRLEVVTRDTDLLARWGGEEFIYVARLDNNERIYQIADRLLKAINSTKFEISDHPAIQVTCTIGVVKYPFIDTDNIELWTRLISLADAALYFGKQRQRNCWVAINSENIRQTEEIDLILRSSLEQSVENKLISLRTSID